MQLALERAVTIGDLSLLEEQLRGGVDVNSRDRYGQSALMLAAHHGHRVIVERLIERGAELDCTAKYNLSALMLAVVAGHVEVARVLLRAGADVSVRGSGVPGFAGKTARELAAARQMRELCEEMAASARTAV